MAPTTNAEEYAIRPLRSQCGDAMFEELCQLILYQGGVKIEERYVFFSPRRRAAVAELLAERFGTRYFELD